MKPELYVRALQYLYYCKGISVISDYEYDHFCKRHGIEGGGGSDLESNYNNVEKELALQLILK